MFQPRRLPPLFVELDRAQRAVRHQGLPAEDGIQPCSLACRRTLTGSGSSSETSPPSVATSLASDDDTNEYRGVVATKNVSTPAMCLFICAICSSYSKSVPVRRPLTIAVSPRCLTKSTTSPSPDSTCRFGRCVVDSSIIAMRSSRLNIPCLLGLISTATTTSSNWAAARSKMSTWPRVTGSKDPGHTAPLMGDDASRAIPLRMPSTRGAYLECSPLVSIPTLTQPQ